MMLPIINVGLNNHIFAKSIVMLMNPESKPAIRFKIKAKEEKRYLDLTTGKAGKCMLLLKNGEVAMSKITVATIKKRYQDYIDVVNKNNGMSLEPFIEVGFDNYVSTYSIHGIYPNTSAPIMNLVKNAKLRGMVLDCTQGDTTRSVLFLDEGYVVLSMKSPEVIKKKYMSYVNKVNNVDGNLLINDEEDEEDTNENEVIGNE